MIAVKFYNELLPKAGVVAHYSDYKVTELAKYLHNCFLATKVAFMNEFYDVCQKLGADYDAVSGAAKSQGMIGLSHLMVPGPDGLRGFGGSCFPKDTSALAGSLPPEYMSILRAAMESNRKVRNA
jgi:UDPglucose 6-dehydrogenase